MAGKDRGLALAAIVCGVCLVVLKELRDLLWSAGVSSEVLGSAPSFLGAVMAVFGAYIIWPNRPQHRLRGTLLLVSFLTLAWEFSQRTPFLSWIGTYKPVFDWWDVAASCAGVILAGAVAHVWSKDSVNAVAGQ